MYSFYTLYVVFTFHLICPSPLAYGSVGCCLSCAVGFSGQHLLACKAHSSALTGCLQVHRCKPRLGVVTSSPAPDEFCSSARWLRRPGNQTDYHAIPTCYTGQDWYRAFVINKTYNGFIIYIYLTLWFYNIINRKLL